MKTSAFLDNLKKKPNQSSTPVLAQFQINRPSSQNYMIPGKDGISQKMPDYLQNRGQEESKAESNGFKPTHQANSYSVLPGHSYKYEGYHNKSGTENPTKKYGNMKNSYVLTQNRDSELTSDSVTSDLQTKKKRLPRVSMPSFVPDSKNQEQEQYPFSKNQASEEKSQHFTKKKFDEKLNSTPLDFKERLLMRKSSTEISKNWQPKFPSKKREKKTLSLNNFDKVKQLGAGKYGKVFLVKDKETNMVFALKIIEKKLLIDEQITEQFIRELKIQLFLDHPNIIKMYGFFDDPTNIYIILQVGLGGQLFKYIKKNTRFPEQKVAIMMRQICQAVNQLHAHQIIHRDIKPENIVMHQNIVKLCDFGWSVHHDQKLRSTFCGTPLYVCPQILRGKNYNEKIDIWSLGVMMYEMLIGENPFNITKEEDLIRIVKQSVNIPQFAKVSPQAADFLHCCLQKKPEDRKSIRQLLNHDFFKKYPQRQALNFNKN